MRTDKALYGMFCGLPEADHRARSPCRVCAFSATGSRLNSASGVSLLDTGTGNAAGGLRPAAVSTIGRPRTESWLYKTARTADKQQFFEHTLRRSSLRQLDQCTGLQEKSRPMMMDFSEGSSW